MALGKNWQETVALTEAWFRRDVADIDAGKGPFVSESQVALQHYQLVPGLGRQKEQGEFLGSGDAVSLQPSINEKLRMSWSQAGGGLSIGVKQGKQEPAMAALTWVLLKVGGDSQEIAYGDGVALVTADVGNGRWIVSASVAGLDPLDLGERLKPELGELCELRPEHVWTVAPLHGTPGEIGMPLRVGDMFGIVHRMTGRMLTSVWKQGLMLPPGGVADPENWVEVVVSDVSRVEPLHGGWVARSTGSLV